MRPPRLRAALLVASLLSLGPLGLAGCGEAGPDAASDTITEPAPTTTSATATETATETATPTAPAGEPLPACDAVWSGATLPRDYAGCLEGDTEVPAAARGCAVGGKLVGYRDKYALTGHQINQATAPLRQDPDWRMAVRSCSG